MAARERAGKLAVVKEMLFDSSEKRLARAQYNGKLEIHNSLLNVVLYDKPQIRTNDHS